VVFFERDVPYYAAHRDAFEWAGGELVLFTSWAEVDSLARRHLDDADVTIVTSYCPDAIVAGERALESRAKLRVFYDLDTPVTLAALNSGHSVAYLGERQLRDFDLVLSYTGGRALLDLQQQLGARRVAPLYGSVDPEAHHRVDPLACFAADLSYLGTYAEDRQDALDALFLTPARRLPHRHFLIGGAQYPTDFPWAANLYFVRHVAPSQHPAFFSSSRITLNVTRRAMRAMGYCPSGRLFEAAACGTPVISDHWEGLELFFEPGAEIIVARSSEEATAAMEYSDAALQRMAQRARERTLDQHTAEHRARYLEDVLSESLSTTAVAGTTERSRQEFAEV
jgi:spore maturation protein CgeB